MPLDIADPAYFRAVVDFAERVGCLPELHAGVYWLDAVAHRAQTQCVVSAASAPYALDFVMFERSDVAWRPVFAGRLAYVASVVEDRATFTFAMSITATRNTPPSGS